MQYFRKKETNKLWRVSTCPCWQAYRRHTPAPPRWLHIFFRRQCFSAVGVQCSCLHRTLKRAIGRGLLWTGGELRYHYSQWRGFLPVCAGNMFSEHAIYRVTRDKWATDASKGCLRDYSVEILSFRYQYCSKIFGVVNRQSGHWCSYAWNLFELGYSKCWNIFHLMPRWCITMA